MKKFELKSLIREVIHEVDAEKNLSNTEEAREVKIAREILNLVRNIHFFGDKGERHLSRIRDLAIELLKIHGQDEKI